MSDVDASDRPGPLCSSCDHAPHQGQCASCACRPGIAWRCWKGKCGEAYENGGYGVTCTHRCHCGRWIVAEDGFAVCRVCKFSSCPLCHDDAPALDSAGEPEATDVAALFANARARHDARQKWSADVPISPTSSIPAWMTTHDKPWEYATARRTFST